MEAMIESPLLPRLMAERDHARILEALKDRFGTVPRDSAKHLREIVDEKKLGQLDLLTTIA
jgi:hypothetical protein